MSYENHLQTKDYEVVQLGNVSVTLFFSDTTTPGTLESLKNILCGTLPSCPQVCHTA